MTVFRSPPVSLAILCFVAYPCVLYAQQAASAGWVSVISRYASSTVLIRMEEPGRPLDYGSGVVCDDSGLVLTARHILPGAAELAGGTFELKGLVNEQSPSHNFDAAPGLTPVFVSDRYDVAVLRFTSAPRNLVAAPAAIDVRQGEPLLILGYPGGGALTATDGLASGNAEDDMYATNAVVGRGNSGGPVFNADGNFVGLLLQGSAYDTQGNVKLGYFRRNGTIIRVLANDPPRISCPVVPPSGPETIIVGGSRYRPPREIRVNYSVDVTKDDHPVVFASHRQDFERRFPAQEGYRIASAVFNADSKNHVASGPTVEVGDGGKTVKMQWTLESGPAVDRWRGWLHGRLETTQAKLGE